MNISTKTRSGRDAAVERPGRLSAMPVTREVLHKSIVAELTDAVIDRMNRDEMVRVIRVSELPTLSDGEFDRRLAMYDCETLRRLTYLGRQCCKIRGY